MHREKKRRWALPLIIFLLGACAVTGGTVYKERGLVTGKAGMNTYQAKEPGETSPIERPYAIAPPLVPHSLAGLTINRPENECMECHLEGVEIEKGHLATKIPPSHFHNEYTGETRTDGVIGIRYNCVQCHVLQSDEKPPVSQMKR